MASIKREKKPTFLEGLRAALSTVQGARKERGDGFSFAEQGIFRLVEERLIARIQQGERRR